MHSSFPDSPIHASRTASATSCFGAVHPDTQHSIVERLRASFTWPERHQFLCLTLPPVQPSPCVSPLDFLLEVLLAPEFVFRWCLLGPFSVFPSSPLRDHPPSSKSDCNFLSSSSALLPILDKESCCLQSTQDFDVAIQFIAPSLSSTFNPSHTITTGLSAFASAFLPTGEPIRLKNGGAVTHVQPQISSAPCILWRARRVRHVADRYPLLSKTICRSQSNFILRISSSGAPLHPALRYSHVMLVMVHARSRSAQVARPSPISMETPPYCSTVCTDSDITRTNPRAGITVLNWSTLPGDTSTSVSGSGSGLSFHLETDVCSQSLWRNFLTSVRSDALRSAACGMNDTPIKHRLRPR